MTRTRTMALAAACTLTGAGGALATDAISTWGHGSHRGTSQRSAFPRGAVHVDAVVPHGTSDFAHVTLDRGVVKSVSGQSLTITEGTKTATYKDVTLTIPSDARIKVPGNDNAALSDLQTGWRVVVADLANKVIVRAGPAGQRRSFGFHRRHRG